MLQKLEMMGKAKTVNYFCIQMGYCKYHIYSKFDTLKLKKSLLEHLATWLADWLIYKKGNI